MEDKILVIRCKNGSPDALSRIYQKYRDHLLVLAVALCHNADVAEDAVHDAFVRFAENLSGFKLTGSLKSYLAICVVNNIRDMMRSRQNRTISLEQDCPQLLCQNDPVSVAMCNEQLQQLSSVLADLPPEQREVIALRIHGQMRFSAIAKSLDISVNTAKGRYRYGLDKLRSIMNAAADLKSAPVGADLGVCPPVGAVREPPKTR